MFGFYFRAFHIRMDLRERSKLLWAHVFKRKTAPHSSLKKAPQTFFSNARTSLAYSEDRLCFFDFDKAAAYVKRRSFCEDRREQQRHKFQRGYTLVEVMVVLLIVSLLTTFVVINVLPSGDKARVDKAQADIRILTEALEMYRLDMYEYPDELHGLDALLQMPEGLKNADRYAQGGYIKYLPDDPWGRPYIYRFPGEDSEFDIISYGADGEPGGDKQSADIVNWERK